MNSVHYGNRKSEYFDSIFEYLTEEEIIPILDRLQERGEDSDIFKGIINTLIQARHVSEDFLMHFSDSLDLSVVKKQYSVEIKSQAYPSIALLAAST